MQQDDRFALRTTFWDEGIRKDVLTDEEFQRCEEGCTGRLWLALYREAMRSVLKDGTCSR